jgi:O-antigen/teichoic acid export membrane protein
LVTHSTRLVNLTLRGITLGTRFLFIFFLARYLDPASVGYYGIFTATIGYAIYLVGLDFYTYVSREIVATPPEERGKLLKAQAALSGLLYLMLFPVALLFLANSDWPGYLTFWFIPILMLEHFNQEVSRLLIALNEQLTSSAILFVRQGSWALAIIIFMYTNASTRNLDFVMALWAMAGATAASIGVWKLKQLKTEGWQLAIDWGWVKKGILVSGSFLIATLALRGVQTIDRYWLESLGGIEIVGAYVLLLGIAGTLLTFLDAAVFAFAYPHLISLNHQNQLQRARQQVKKLFIQTMVISVLFAVTSWLVLPFFLGWIGNSLYQDSAHWYPWLLAAMIFNALGMVPHYALYAMGNDKPIIHSHIAALVVFLAITATISNFIGFESIFLGLIFSFATLLIWKGMAYLILSTKVKPTTPTPANI